VTVDFDDYSHAYQELMNTSIWLSGEKNDYFDRYKVNCLTRWVVEKDQAAEILDFGCGIGKLTNIMAQTYPQSTIYGYDVSSKSIELAREKWGHLENLIFGRQLPAAQIYDLITVANVFHHIKWEDRRKMLFRLRTLLKTGGMIVVFEHNPLNPLTVHTVRTCPFDTDAELIRCGQFVKLAVDCGLKVRLKRYIVFFPKFLRFCRVIEAYLGFLPLGAQYMVSFVETDK